MNILLVSYINRSGSTLLLAELSKVSNFVCLPESDILAKYLLAKPHKRISIYSSVVKMLDRALIEDSKLQLFKPSRSFSDLFESTSENISFFELFCRFVDSVAKAENPNYEWVVFKNTHLGRLFPMLHKANANINLRLINLVRDPRAIFESQRRTIGSWGKPMCTSSMSLAIDWNRFIGISKNNEGNFSGFCATISYEEIVRETDNAIKSLLFWLGANPSKAKSFLPYVNKIAPQLKNVHLGIGAEPNSDFLYKWSRSLKPIELFSIETTCKNLMQEYGYNVQEPIRVSPKMWLEMKRLYLLAWLRLLKKTVAGIEIPPKPLAQ